MTFSSSMSKLDSKILIVQKVLWYLFTVLETKQTRGKFNLSPFQGGFSLTPKK